MKKAIQSKTIWFNTLTALTVIATAFGYTPNQDVAEITTTLLLALTPIVNIILRFVTNKGITVK